MKYFVYLTVALFGVTSLHATALEDLEGFISEAKDSGKIDTSKKGWRTRLPKFPEVELADSEEDEWVIETSEGTIVADLEESIAPDHTRNILYLSLLGYYDGLIFHRIMPDFMAQGGCPKGTGTGGPGYSIDLEVSSKLKHDRAGTLSMARSSNPNSAGSQFFITFRDTPFLDGGYSVFGYVKEGLDVIKKLEEPPKPNPRSTGVPPRKRITITSASVRLVTPDTAP
mgnify:CR=1 FL=1